MVNSLTNIMPKILARALMSLRTRCIMPRMVNSDYSIEARKKGVTIDIPVPTAVGTQQVAGSSTDVGPTDLTPALVQVALDQWYQNDPIGLTDKELCEIDETDKFLPMQLEEAVKALASLVNQNIFSKYKGSLRGVYGFASNPNTGVGTIEDPFGDSADTGGVSGATVAKKILNKQLCPRTDRRGVLNFNAEAAALDLSAFSDAEKIMSAVVKMEGEIGRKFGIDWVADDDVPDHTVGTAYDATPSSVTVKGAEAVGSVALGLIDDTAGSPTVVRGDIITIAGDSQTYVVIGDATYTLNADGTTAVEVGILPALKVECSGTEVVTIKNSHAVNMVFHRDAFAFATRPLLDNSRNYALGTQMLSMQDPKTGLILRLEVSRQHKQTVWEFDILWGADLIRPELAMRLAGAV